MAEGPQDRIATALERLAESAERTERLLAELLRRRQATERGNRTRRETVARKPPDGLRIVPDDVTRARARKLLRKLEDHR